MQQKQDAAAYCAAVNQPVFGSAIAPAVAGGAFKPDFIDSCTVRSPSFFCRVASFGLTCMHFLTRNAGAGLVIRERRR